LTYGGEQGDEVNYSSLVKDLNINDLLWIRSEVKEIFGEFG
jgi:hypothetical protein